MIKSSDVKKMVLELMAGVLPPWVSGMTDMSSPSRVAKNTQKDGNPIELQRYTGVYNSVIGWAVAARRGGGNLFATFNQWRCLAKDVGFKGLIMPKGSSSTNVFLYPVMAKNVLDTSENRKKYPRFTIVKEDGKATGKLNPNILIGYGEFKVFHQSVITPELVAMVKDKYCSAKETEQDVNASAAQAMIDKLDLHIEWGQPSYAPCRDTVYMTDVHSFDKVSYYYGALIHEIGHWTGHPSRLGRESVSILNKPTAHTYSYEEMVAEWFACLQMSELGLIAKPKDLENHAAYLKGWKKRNPKPESILEAFFDAQSAVRFVSNKVKEQKEETEREAVAS